MLGKLGVLDDVKEAIVWNGQVSPSSWQLHGFLSLHRDPTGYTFLAFHNDKPRIRIKQD